MSKRQKFPDKSSLGPSETCPFRKNESANRRHKRRLNTNLNMSEILNNWCTERGVIVQRTNHGHHWSLFKAGHLAEWWPSSAKLVFDKKWKKGIHCHDVHKLISAVERRWNLTS